MLKQLLHHVERLSDKYEVINRKVDTIMTWMRPSQHLNREHSFGVDGVFETKGNNHEEVEREIDGGDIMEENGAWDAVGEFAAQSAVMETVAGGIESEAETREIGREAVAGGIEIEAEAAGAEIETVLGNIEREMDVVDNDVGINERTRMYTKGCITNDQLKDNLKAASIIVPLLSKKINIDLETDTLAIERSKKTTKQVISSDCGMYVVKYIEFLSINDPIEQVNGFYMNRWREMMAADIFALDYEP
ncbi:ubiquitin-like-specific protease 1A [Olea europaea subsp. europaea]|uniref:Ubiquitin-like-specific protease 1A n=1 Tax=Olea europaea subsp. europaea TaxID=158383 RepID=A0A8S0QKA6_OLEEU|nr:ubiquitin-like-specific protease 1A [Olea europaea subsp. europaea]